MADDTSDRYRLDSHSEADGWRVEYWQGFREWGLVRLLHGEARLDLYAELLGWGEGQKMYLGIDLPSSVEFGGAALTGEQLLPLAARTHLGLCLCGLPHAITVHAPHQPLDTAARLAALAEFNAWMSRRGWRVSADERTLRIQRNGWRLFSSSPSHAEIIERGGRVAAAWNAHLTTPGSRGALYISEGCDYAAAAQQLRW
ncbi:MAG: hypothetical protein J0L64_08810 [Acidobacteria bacterium]|nr:hypothetical protein [Acidobacteriota bacterium]